ncbi:methyltransferase family protein [Azospirillum brasilense]|uniref:Methyltransferase family protein n=1 Tax=Azospirillum brasilense TaxID=192 RepID=A0A560AKY7_AZOBR|nr:class I SAM-dependent methyltransferase [Azospirillum brasilense]TWA61033.1 methyltransferase family protein [Azospirillum brasilense]
MTDVTRRHGDYTGLAQDYDRFRPSYALSPLKALLALLDKPVADVDAADVGAGTGIWTRILAGQGLRSLTAVEPNDDMRRVGRDSSAGLSIEWRAGQGEATGLTDGSRDLVTMASSFHWVDYDAGMSEFRRILRPGGRFAALWNPRLIEASPIQVDIENHLSQLCPGMKRVSSGRSGLTDHLTDRLAATPGFSDVVYMEARDVMTRTPEEYLGAWRSVNDVQVQLGPERFEEFLGYAAERIRGCAMIETVYLTRLWTVRRD